MTKPFTEFGVPLDGNFAVHVALCVQCRGFDPTRPVTAAALCLEGAVLWKRENVAPVKTFPDIIDPHRVSLKVAKLAMRYKE